MAMTGRWQAAQPSPQHHRQSIAAPDETQDDHEATIQRGQRKEFLNMGPGAEVSSTTSIRSSRSFAHGKIRLANRRNQKIDFSFLIDPHDVLVWYIHLNLAGRYVHNADEVIFFDHKE
jgi:hypothetical protein